MDQEPQPNSYRAKGVRGNRRGVLRLLSVTVVVCLFYVQSTGPALKLVTAKVLPATVVMGFYKPLVAVSDSWPALKRFLDWYVKDVWAAYGGVKYQRMDD